MTSRERILTALRGGCPDYVPAAPDLYEMIPLRLSGRKPWELLEYNDPPIWKARIDACVQLGVDAFVPLWVPAADDPAAAIVQKTEQQVIVRRFVENDGRRQWQDWVMVYTIGHPSSYVLARDLGLPDSHDTFEIIRPDYAATDQTYFEDARRYLGDRGVIAPLVSLPCLSHREDEMLAYYDDPDRIRKEKQAAGEAMMARAKEIMSWRPEVLLIGNSGTMLFNPPPVFRDLALGWMKKLTALAKAHGVLTHMHCCGTERALVQMAVEETDLNGIEPLEAPPMGDCILKEIKQQFGSRIALKGNLHTTDVMLFGTAADVERACKQAIDDAADGGGFILSTGDQTPADTPLENIEKMVNIAQTYGRY